VQTDASHADIGPAKLKDQFSRLGWTVTCSGASTGCKSEEGHPRRNDKKPIAGDLLGQGEPGRPAVGWGPNAGGEFSQEDYHHPAAGWGAARSVAKALAQSRQLVSGARAIRRMNHENGGFDCPGCAWPDDTKGVWPPVQRARPWLAGPDQWPMEGVTGRGT
jgi:hypothetical protein